MIEEAGGGPAVAGVQAGEITEICTDQDLASLPLYYEEFLFRMGRGAGQLLVGTDAFYPSILGAKEDARNLLSENSASHLMRESAVVFAIHQGYQLYWLESLDDDPPVAFYEEGDIELRRRWETFSSFLLDQASRDLRHHSGD